MKEQGEYLLTQLGRSLGNEAAFEALLLALISEHPSLKEKFIRNLSAQQNKANQLLDGVALVSFSARLKFLQDELNVRS